MLIFCTMLIGMEGAKTPAGAAGQVRPHRRLSAEEAHRPPRGKQSAWNGNQHSSLSRAKVLNNSLYKSTFSSSKK
ncbi:MAG: hypothetical protein K0S25_2058 [Bacillus sp. (in: firmicutes)]|nr:hypothetical protein [Bacillus sp. (in: firmicutes)]